MDISKSSNIGWNNHEIIRIILFHSVAAFYRIILRCFADLLYFSRGITPLGFSWHIRMYAFWKEEAARVFSPSISHRAKNIFHSFQTNIWYTPVTRYSCNMALGNKGSFTALSICILHLFNNTFSARMQNRSQQSRHAGRPARNLLNFTNTPREYNLFRSDTEVYDYLRLQVRIEIN